MQASDALDSNDGRYEELLASWADLEAGLSVLLAVPSQVHGFAAKIAQYDRWMRDLLAQDTDIALYLLFQLAATSSAGYSASHALVCAVLCHVTAAELRLGGGARDSLVHAAMTMNLSITRLQDQLATQSGRLTPEQQVALQRHGTRSAAMLRTHGVSDAQWLDVVTGHHDVKPAADTDAAALLTQLLQLIDRYGAMISPRGSRAGRDVSESLRALNVRGDATQDRLGRALVTTVGTYPPGTFVRLADGARAVVLRRSADPQLPFLALLTDPAGHPLAQARLQRGAAKIEAAVAAHTVGMRLNHRTLVQLGLFAVRPVQREISASS